MKEQLITASQIADILGEPPERVNYIIRKHRIKHVDRIGIIRRFSSTQIQVIKKALYGIQIRG